MVTHTIAFSHILSCSASGGTELEVMMVSLFLTFINLSSLAWISTELEERERTGAWWHSLWMEEENNCSIANPSKGYWGRGTRNKADEIISMDFSLIYKQYRSSPSVGCLVPIVLSYHIVEPALWPTPSTREHSLVSITPSRCIPGFLIREQCVLTTHWTTE